MGSSYIFKHPPQWLDLDKYDSYLCSYNAVSWYTAISTRKNVINELDSGNTDSIAVKNFNILIEKYGFVETTTNFDRSDIIDEANVYEHTISIDIHAPTACIKEQFEQWLKDKKKQTVYTKQFSETERNKLLDNKIIPLLDLKIHEIQNNITYTDYSLIDFLFSDYEGDNDIEKVKNAKRILKHVTTKDYLNWLYSHRWIETDKPIEIDNNTYPYMHDYSKPVKLSAEMEEQIQNCQKNNSLFKKI